MKHYKLTKDQSAAYSGYTDLYEVDESDLTESTVNTDQTLTLDTLAFGDVVVEDVLLRIVTPFTGNTADNTLEFQLGIPGNSTRLLGNANVVVGGTPIDAGAAWGHGSTATPLVGPSGGTSLILTANITDADGSLAMYTAGKVHLFVKILRAAHLNVAV